MFYTFSQNNSGGSFSHNEKAGIGYRVCIEANSAKEANRLAEDIGLYFDGAGDCPCCGDRWYEVSDFHGKETPEDCYAGWGIFGYTHYLDGRIEKVEKEYKW